MRNEILRFQVPNKELLKIFTSFLHPDVRQRLNDVESVEFIRKGSDTIVSFVNFLESDALIDNHLGGCSKRGDPATWTPQVWDTLIKMFDINSVLDVGCGYGHSTKYFSEKVEKVLGIEGSEKAIKDSLIKEKIIQHDYSEGSFVPNDIFDLIWCCEFVEHVEEIFMNNFLETFKKAKFIAMTYASPGQGGHHHVNEQPESYWIDAMKHHNFIFLEKETKELKRIAFEDGKIHNSVYNDNHFAHRGLVFKNLDLVK